jgi:hypothetical protein
MSVRVGATLSPKQVPAKVRNPPRTDLNSNSSQGPVWGKERQFSRPRLNGRCRLRKRFFAANNQAILVFDGLSLSALEPQSALIAS